MTEVNENRPVGAGLRMLLVALSAIFIGWQGWTLLGPGGIMSKYTLLEGFTEFDDLMLADPLATAGLIDLLFLWIAMIIVILNGVPRGRSYRWVCAALLGVMIVYPGAGALAFLLVYWKRLGQFRA